MKPALALFLMVALLSAAPADITTANTSRHVGDGRWDWTVSIRAAKPVLDRIQCVEYTLHPSFPNPVRRVCSRGTGTGAFPLSTTGWGTFRIRVRILFRDGTQQMLEHQLVLQ